MKSSRSPNVTLDFVEARTVAEWSKALRLREKINEHKNIPGSARGLGNLSKTLEFVHMINRPEISQFKMTWLSETAFCRETCFSIHYGIFMPRGTRV